MEHQQYSQNPAINSLLVTILQCSQEISELMENTPVHKAGSTNVFGDEQLHLDVDSDNLIEKHLRENEHCHAMLSEERPEWLELGKGDYIVTFDPLDGSSILDTNFSIGSIFAIWKKDANRLIGAKISDSLVTGVIVVYGPRTTAIIYNDVCKSVQELTLVRKQWQLTETELTIAKDAKIYAPGNLRAASENKEYLEVMGKWMARGLTLRYTGGLVPDINQLFIKGNGIFVAVASPTHKAKLRVLYEVAPVVFLIEKAAGRTVARKLASGMDYVIKSYNDKLEFACGSENDVEAVKHLFL